MTVTLDESTIKSLLLQHGWECYNNAWVRKEWLTETSNDKNYYRYETLESALTLMLDAAYTPPDFLPDDLRWVQRYSQTDEPDKHGRWARIMYIGSVPHAWVNRLDIDGDVRYSARLYFPTLQNDTAYDHYLNADFSVVKDWCEKQLTTYIKNVKQYK